MRKVDRQVNEMENDGLQGALNGGRKQKTLPAALMLAATGAVLMLASSSSNTGINEVKLHIIIYIREASDPSIVLECPCHLLICPTSVQK